ncbi:MAG: formylmethanofuran dehydrogenase subunit E family protein [Candidatus Omnitrophota bacterium]
MGNRRVSLKEGIKFHGHLGPWLVLGLLVGEAAISKLGCKKHFGLSVKAWGANQRPKSCLIDGLQLATGATYGKGNIEKLNGRAVKIEVCSRDANKKAVFKLRQDLLKRLEKADTHEESEILAKIIFRSKPSKLFCITISTPNY